MCNGKYDSSTQWDKSISFIQPYRDTENGLELSTASSSVQIHWRAGKSEVGLRRWKKKIRLS